MGFIRRDPAIAIVVTLLTFIVCTFGIRAELKEAKQSVLDHRLRPTPGENAAPGLFAVDDKRGTELAPP
jgi:hypothetical protein